MTHNTNVSAANMAKACGTNKRMAQNEWEGDEGPKCDYKSCLYKYISISKFGPVAFSNISGSG